MPFEKGHKKATGRPKGSANKSSAIIRDAFASLLEDNLEQITKDFKTLDPEKRVKLFLDMSKYIIPTLKATELDLGDKTLDKFNKPLAEFFGVEDKRKV
jgi:hypothetical protein